MKSYRVVIEKVSRHICKLASLNAITQVTVVCVNDMWKIHGFILLVYTMQIKPGNFLIKSR